MVTSRILTPGGLDSGMCIALFFAERSIRLEIVQQGSKPYLAKNTGSGSRKGAVKDRTQTQQPEDKTVGANGPGS